MTIKTDDDNDNDNDNLDMLLAGPLLDVPEHFAAQVMARLPARPRRTAPHPTAASAWRVVQAIALAVCGACGAAEVLFFVCGLWTTTAVGIG